MLPRLCFSALDLQAGHAIRGYIAQASSFPDTWDYINLMIQHGALRQHCKDSAQYENAARVAIARPLLVALLQGQTLIQAHVSFQP